MMLLLKTPFISITTCTVHVDDASFILYCNQSTVENNEYYHLLYSSDVVEGLLYAYTPNAMAAAAAADWIDRNNHFHLTGAF